MIFKGRAGFAVLLSAVPFSLNGLREDLANAPDDPGKYKEALQVLTQFFSLTWKDIVWLLNPALPLSEKHAAFHTVEVLGDELLPKP